MFQHNSVQSHEAQVHWRPEATAL